ncbi:MAG: CPBP family intramembrane metalloprotease [Clostridia bacterium]|nr:CPBP family intramembrane metalloprotease [Clostridia bacterium]
MKKLFPMTHMMLDARCCPKRRGLFFELLIFYLAYWVIKMIESIIAAIPQTAFLLQDTELALMLTRENMETLTVEEFTTAFTDAALRMPPWVVLFTLFATVITVVGAIFVCVKLEKRNLSSMGVRRRGALVEYLIGLGLGAVLFGLAVLIAWGTGAISIQFQPEADLGMIALFFLAFMVQALSEELLCRGYLMMTLSRTASPLASVLISAVVFAALHSGNTAVTPLALLNITLVGIVFGVYMLKRGSIWGAAAMHAAWNFVQGNIFGAPVSGTTMGASLFTVSFNATKTHVSGGDFGLEGGLAVTIVLLIALGLVFPLKTKQSELVSVYKEEDRAAQE